ncbi:hypothetical protein L2E82_51421 [Cichorium intybus]|nr:hypothetical protein L2E82_51421 [Cichorium intybus]
MNLYKVRVTETDEKVFFPCVSYPEDQVRRANSDREDEEEEDDQFQSSDGQLSEDFSDGEEEASFGESMVQETSPEEMINKDGVNRAVENNDHNWGDVEENGKHIGLLPILEKKKLNPNPLEKDDGPFPVDPKQKQLETQEADQDVEKVLEVKSVADNSMGSPQFEMMSEALKGVSDKLKNLLSRNTSMKEKIDNIDKKEEEGNEKLQEENGNLGESEIEEFGEKMGFRAQDGKESQKNMDLFERRVTRSQTQQFRKNEC